MTSCLAGRIFKSKGSINNISALSLLDATTLFEPFKNKSDVIRSVAPDVGSFKLKGNFVFAVDGQLNWDDSEPISLHYKSFNDRSKNFKIIDKTYSRNTLKEYLLSGTDDKLAYAFNFLFEYRGSKKIDTIDISNLAIENLANSPYLSGGSGADTIVGSDAKDLIAASTSRDTCDIGSGTNLSKKVKDVLIGGKGIDTFYVDNGTKINDVEAGESLHLNNHSSYDLRNLADKMPIIKYKLGKTIIKVGEIRVVTNPVKYDYSYGFISRPEMEFCYTTHDGTECSLGLIPGQTEGYRFTAI